MKTNRPLGWRKESPLDEFTKSIEEWKLPPEMQRDLRLGRKVRKLVTLLPFILIAPGAIALVIYLVTNPIGFAGWVLESAVALAATAALALFIIGIVRLINGPFH